MERYELDVDMMPAPPDEQNVRKMYDNSDSVRQQPPHDANIKAGFNNALRHLCRIVILTLILAIGHYKKRLPTIFGCKMQHYKPLQPSIRLFALHSKNLQATKTLKFVTLPNIFLRMPLWKNIYIYSFTLSHITFVTPRKNI